MSTPIITAANTVAGRIMQYELGELESEEQVVDLFQELVDSGLVWKLQPHYIKSAKFLIQAGLVELPNQLTLGEEGESDVLPNLSV